MKKILATMIVCLLMTSACIGIISVNSVSASQPQPTTMANIFTETFENNFPGERWIVGDWESTNGADYWDDTAMRSFQGDWSCWCADIGTHVAEKYDDYMDAYMYILQDLSGYTGVTLSYHYWLQSEATWDTLEVMYYSSSTWHYIDTHSGSSGGWASSQVSIPSTATRVGFFFDSDGSECNYEGAYVDSISLDGTPVEYYVTVTTNPTGRTFTSDGTTYSNSVTFTWVAGSTHTIATTSPQGTGDTRYSWSSWSDGGAISHTVTATGPMTYTATFTTEHKLTITKSPTQTIGNIKLGSTWYNSVSSASAWFTAGTSQAIQVTTPDTSGTMRYAFTSWAGDKTGTTNPTTITMNSPKSVTANYNTQYSLSVSSPYGTTAGSGWYISGATAHAELNTGIVAGTTGTRYKFTQWTGDASGTDYSESDPITMSSAKTATAEWATQYQLTVASSSVSSVDIYLDGSTTASGTTSLQTWFDKDSTHTVKVAPSVIQSDNTYDFVDWTLSTGTSTDNPISVQMGSAKTITANYVVRTSEGWAVGFVYADGTTTPISGATVTATGGATATTGADGSYNITLAAGSYTLTAEKTGYESTTQSVTITNGQKTTTNFNLIQEDEEDTETPVEPTDGTVEGYVYITGTTTPINEATIQIQGGASATTDSTGYYSLSLSPGTYTLTASKSGYTTDTKTITAATGQVTTRDFSLAPTGSDTDNDGLPDDWETEHFSNLLQTSSQDADSDGLTNLQEFAMGTEPDIADTDEDGIIDGDDPNPLVAEADTEENILNNQWLWILLIVVICGILGSAIYLRPKKQPEKEQENQPSEKEP